MPSARPWPGTRGRCSSESPRLQARSRPETCTTTCHFTQQGTHKMAELVFGYLDQHTLIRSRTSSESAARDERMVQAERAEDITQAARASRLVVLKSVASGKCLAALPGAGAPV